MRILNALVGGRDLAATVFDLIRWAESRGHTSELIAGAIRMVPGNPKLKAIADTLGYAEFADGAQRQTDDQQVALSGGARVARGVETDGEFRDREKPELNFVNFLAYSPDGIRLRIGLF